ncbi:MULTISPECIES: hypothetical protein [Methanobacterium]|jgi:hypothetical protein|uniref:Uncharacterized protein n=1 Tax=Methanobacterium bryantii TaxID=2161 RepID=A0A2A2H478_METBR|nr:MULTISPECIES: hypothetical protein [Methanobacterium]OEC84618.1 hypothetical protein A9507_15165 [Methanobacterium sp. A39]PAV04090.1 hypothetical protein ASJ80_03490 [Methanobacterium bryantii]
MSIDPKEKVLFNLLAHGYINKRHTTIDNACKSFPKGEKNKAKHAINELILEGIILVKKTHHGADIYINPKMIRDILEMPGIKALLEENRFLKGRFQKYLKNY